jgi:Na+/melibiose symporter-like transporter
MQMTGLGVVRAFVPNIAEQAFRNVFALQWAVGGLPILLFFIVPESPHWLLLKGKTEDARKSFGRLYGKEASLDARVAHLNNVLRHEINNEAGVTYLDCFRGTNLRRTLIVALLFWGNGMIGSSFLSQNIYFLIVAGLEPIHCFDIGIGGFALGLLIIPLSSIFSEKIGRRPLYLIGVFGNAVGMAIVGVLGYVSGSAVTWAVAVLLYEFFIPSPYIKTNTNVGTFSLPGNSSPASWSPGPWHLNCPPTNFVNRLKVLDTLSKLPQHWFSSSSPHTCKHLQSQILPMIP